MANLIDWILDAANGEPIEAVVIGELGWEDYGSDAVPQYATQRRGQILTWGEARPMLDYDFDRGFGAPGCNAVYVWTATKVMFVTQYDGSTTLDIVPRHPTAVVPSMPGG